MSVCIVYHTAREDKYQPGEVNISLSSLAPEVLVSRDIFGSTVPRQPAHLDT